MAAAGFEPLSPGSRSGTYRLKHLSCLSGDCGDELCNSNAFGVWGWAALAFYWRVEVENTLSAVAMFAFPDFLHVPFFLF